MPAKIALWQGKPTVEDSLAQLETIAAEAAGSGVDLLVLPELFLGGYDLNGVAARSLTADGPALCRASNIAKKHGVALVFGFPEAVEGPVGQRQVCDSVVAIDASGIRTALYRKTHLFGAKEKAVFTPGSCLGEVFSLAGLRVGLLICYDVEFPEAVRKLALNGAELILVPTANYTPYDYVNDKLVPCRAFENHVHVAYVNWAYGVPGGESFNGRSVLVDPQGELLLQFGGEESGLKLATLEGRSSGPAQGLEDNYLQDRRPELYRPAPAKMAGKAPKLLIVNGVTGAIGNAVLGQAVQCPDTVVYGLSRQGLPWQQMVLHGCTKLPPSTLVASLGGAVENEKAIRGFVGAIDFSCFSAVWYCHAVGKMPFEVDEHGHHVVSNDDDNDGIDDTVLKLTGQAFPRMAQALAEATSLPTAAVTFGALSDVWEVSVHGSWIKAMQAAKDSMTALVKVHQNLSGCILNISSVACAHEILTRPYVTAQTRAKLDFWLPPWELADKVISLLREAKAGVLLEEDFFRPLARFDAAAYYSESRFTAQKMLELFRSEPENGDSAGPIAKGMHGAVASSNGSSANGVANGVANSVAVNGSAAHTTANGGTNGVTNGAAVNGSAAHTTANGVTNGAAVNGSTAHGGGHSVANGVANGMANGVVNGKAHGVSGAPGALASMADTVADNQWEKMQANYSQDSVPLAHLPMTRQLTPQA